jgi:arylsulfatase A-like enzyme
VGSGTLPDILFVVLDAARADRAGCYGHARAATPTLDRLANAGLRCDQAIATSCWTLESVASLLTGRYPADHGAHFGTLKLAAGLDTIPSWLQGLGYRTMAVSGNSAFVGRHTGLDRGFGIFEEVAPEVVPPEEALGGAGGVLPLKDSAGRMAAAAERLLHRALPSPEPIFLYLHFVDTHLPYYPPQRFAEPFLRRINATTEELLRVSQDAAAHFAGRRKGGDRGFEILAALYDGAYSWMDHQLGRVIDAFVGSGRSRERLIVVTADHGEHLGEGGMMDHAFSLSDTLVRVPLVVCWPGVLPAGSVMGRQVQPHDLYPSLLGRLEGTASADRLFPDRCGILPGDPAPRGRCWALAQYTEPVNAALRRRYPGEPVPGQSLSMVRGEGWKLVLGGDGSARLYRLGDDPGEHRDVARLHPRTVAALRGRLPERMAPRPPGSGGWGAPGPPELVERLAALGYL